MYRNAYRHRLQKMTIRIVPLDSMIDTNASLHMKTDQGAYPAFPNTIPGLTLACASRYQV